MEEDELKQTQAHKIQCHGKQLTLRRGDQLVVETEVAGINCYHHGIFLGHEKGVADFGGINKHHATVRTVKLSNFTNKHKKRIVRINYPNNDCLPPEIAAMNAEMVVTDPHRWGPYDALTNNCEHFAVRCKTGVAVSSQVLEKLRECLLNPVQAARYFITASVKSGCDSISSLLKKK
ncbi:unnamed protein product [Mytilus coruscus]|uniref:LRAT domain-containing protein n=1 Tax=Mytilus coruscus TaxID=42192 RepID=A0A6J8ECU4_MYTCO|nr:unnamed protein product [Mytilus coruscus]